MYIYRQCYGFPPFISSCIFTKKQNSMALKRPGRPAYLTELAKDKIENRLRSSKFGNRNIFGRPTCS